MNDKNELIGVITLQQITHLLSNFKINLDSTINKGLTKEFKKMDMSQSVKYLSKALKRHQFIIVTGEEKFFVCENKHLLNHFMKNIK